MSMVAGRICIFFSAPFAPCAKGAENKMSLQSGPLFYRHDTPNRVWGLCGVGQFFLPTAEEGRGFG